MALKGTTTLPCVCVHAGQDSMYGRAIRVFNRVFKNTKGRAPYPPRGWRCTVCSRETA